MYLMGKILGGKSKEKEVLNDEFRNGYAGA
jgi:hypothetical protein